MSLQSKLRILVCLAFFAGLGWRRNVQSSGAPENASASSFIRGVDVSYVTRVEQRGGVYRYADGTPGDVFEILRQSGVNYVRLRVWNDPVEGYCNEADVLALARRARTSGLKILLDFHYSDGWADPEKQVKPAAWQSLSYEQLKTSVYTYTAHVVNALILQDSPPDMVQIGNEITNGMLWDDGRVGPSGFDTQAQWAQLAGLIQAGIDGVKATGSTARIMIHIDRGGDYVGTRDFFDHLIDSGVAFDVIGLSYYSYWHGTLEQLHANLNDLAQRYDQEIVIAETAYPWTLGWNDWTHNVIGLQSQLLPGYEARAAGQTAFLRDVMARVQDAPNERGAGIFYWGGEWISTAITDTNGSSWENQALFDFDGRALETLNIFRNTLYLPVAVVP